MAAEALAKVATSNHLIEGDVIYFAHGVWLRDLARAEVARTPEEADDLLRRARAFPHETVGVELVDVALEAGVPRPVHFREAFRTRGPSNYFHGKQADHV
ncbi:DUF2849 domain-containing protein [Rhodalgimonas zhirmunskyi]|uniref:DUF2849 domain-containing protein n=1 Tax=Rhodalgimonas zhirmunskyi TaxID=2964767 RepID=A0AAJ1X4E1_9RHOB|nr:DUF2849 domain-containing protein [Rhodoalgimonas zhirmunskyi]MDQ2093411.1 DUF2849 domain-containing protein [Rhodoalgimonas zhirmunskyi]